MDVLASYDTSSDDEKEGKAQKKKPATSVAEDITPEHEMRESNAEIPEIKGESKETLPISPSLSSKREESHRNRRYRQRSRSPGDSPSKCSPTSRRSSREERRGNARSRSRSHSPKIRNSSRSKSPNRFLHLDNVEVEPGVQVQLKTLLQKVDTLLENQRAVLENQARLLSMLGNHEHRTSSDPSPERLVRESVNHNVSPSCEKTSVLNSMDISHSSHPYSAEAQQTVYVDENIQVVHLKPAVGSSSDKLSSRSDVEHQRPNSAHVAKQRGSCPVIPTPEVLTKAMHDTNSNELLAWTEESSERDSGQTDEFGRDLRPPHRRLPSKEKDLERSHSRSPEKRESKERPRNREHRRSPGRDGREKRPSFRRDRDQDRDRDRDRDRRDRDRDRGRHERGRNWSDRRRSSDGGYERSRDRRRSGETERDDKDRKSPQPSVAPKPPPKPVVLHLQGNRPLSSEEIQAKLAAQAEIMKSQAHQAAAALNMPSYLNPSVVNPQQYAVQAQKRKLLWSTKNKETPTAVWNATSFTNDTSGEVQAKFRRLMGIKEGEAEQQGANPGTENSGAQSQQLLDDLQNEFERSRAFQLSRGAGGKSGIGLGYTGM